MTCRIVETISESLLLDGGVCGREEFRSGLGVGRGCQGPKGNSGGVQQEPAETAGLGCAAPLGSSFLRAPAQACLAHSHQAPGDGQAELGVAVLGRFLLAAGSL